MKKWVLALLVLMGGDVRADILRIEIDGIIDPVTSQFMAQAVRQAETERAEFLLMRLETPGGLGISMQEIIQYILNSRVPVVCFVGPKGAHAASAGFFILLSADVAAMAPGTNTGAAHPVFPLGMEDRVMLEKVKNDALASLRSIVKQRRRNYDLAAKGVLESQSFTAQEALEGGLIDLVVEDEQQLLTRLDGRKITRFDGRAQVLSTRNQKINTLQMSWRQRVLSTIADPNVAMILGMVGLLGLYLEFTNPGVVLPGIAGGIALLLSLLGFSFLPVSSIGILLILLAIGLMIAEVKVQGFGLLGMGGAVALVLGLLFLVDAPYPELRIGLVMAVSVALPFVLIFTFLLRLVLKSSRQQVTTGAAGLVGAIGVARSMIGPEQGKIFVAGELWQAVSQQSIPEGAPVRVVEVKGLTLLVEPVEKGS
ncbi:MAG: nodulation protein NfeD [Acidobacteria bacterium]|nr:nodulation protein NfeD [Acidobacteriota bacterium]